MKHKYIALFAALALFCGCESDDSDFDDIIAALQEEQGDSVMSIAFDYSVLYEEEAAYADDDNDYVENSTFSNVIYVVYSGNTATLSGDVDAVSATVSGAHVVVEPYDKNIEYVLSGQSDDGSFKTYGENKFKITLDGLDLTNPTGAVINNQCKKTAYIVLADGSDNSLADGSAYDLPDEEDMKGALFSEGQLAFSGSGTLTVTASYKNAIVSDDYIVFRAGNVINATSTAGNAIKANDGIYIRGGVLNIAVSADGAKGLNCEAETVISGGRTTIITSGGTHVEGVDTTGCGGLKSDLQLSVTAGTLLIKSTGEGAKGINCNADIAITGGTVCCVTLGEKGNTSPKGIKADGTIAVSDAHVYSYSAYSDPIDAALGLTVADGYSLLTDDAHLFEVSYDAATDD